MKSSLSALAILAVTLALLHNHHVHRKILRRADALSQDGPEGEDNESREDRNEDDKKDTTTENAKETNAGKTSDNAKNDNKPNNEPKTADNKPKITDKTTDTLKSSLTTTKSSLETKKISTSESSKTTTSTTSTSSTSSSSTSTTSTSSTSSSSTSPTTVPKIVSLSSVLPSITTNLPPLLSSSTPTYSITIPLGAQGKGNMEGNPYISTLNLPSGTIFIILGTLIGIILMAFLLFNVILSYIFNKKAKYDKEVYFHNSNGSFFNNSSAFDSHSSIAKFSTTTSTLIDTTAGKSYRGSLLGEKSMLNTGDRNSRCSMFISPVLEFMNNKSDLSLPLYQKPYDSNFFDENPADGEPFDEKHFDNKPYEVSPYMPSTLDVIPELNLSHFFPLKSSHKSTITKSPDLSNMSKLASSEAGKKLSNRSLLTKSPNFMKLNDLDDEANWSTTIEVENEKKTKHKRRPSQYLEDLCKTP